MEQESLDKALDSIFATLDRLDINTVDKVDFLVNFKTLLSDVDTYNKSISILQREMPHKREMSVYEFIRKH